MYPTQFDETIPGREFAAKARVSPLGSPSVMDMLAPLVQRMSAFAYGENEFM